jgi:diguanylate cyclase (GGDEF)-like protein
MPINKKTKAATASGTAKRPKRGGAGKAARARTAPASVSQPQPVSDIAKQTIRRLKARLAEAEKRIEALQALSDTDFLLEILNRRGFERELHRSVAYIKRYHASAALIVLDVDHLKPINDAYGHAAGDQVLKAIVTAVASQVRSSDVIGRLGGDEFAILLWNLSEIDARAKAASLEQAIDALTFVFRGSTLTTGASAGVAMLNHHAEAGKAMEEADRAMYVRKAQRRHETGTSR